MTFDTGLDPYYVHPDDFQVCFQSETPFLDRLGDWTTLGLLPDCDIDYDPSSTCLRCLRAWRAAPRTGASSP